MTTNNNQVILSKAPPIPLNLDPDNYSDCRYIVYKMVDGDIESYLVSERKSNSNLTTTITAYNYDTLYYVNDKQYSKGEINENAYPITVAQ